MPWVAATGIKLQGLSEIPAAVDTAGIGASFRKGVLTIKLPKTREAQEKVKHIDVKAA